MTTHKISNIGFGAYRVSIKSKEHQKALTYALQSGLNLIDTSANYTDGESEQLIGKVLADNPNFNPCIVTKGGYIQGKNLAILQDLNARGKARTDLVNINDYLKHSIHPEFLENQIELSLQRLKIKTIDSYLLHNPEYYFKTKNSHREEYYTRLQKAFVFLEEKVREGKIKSYGISSNTFPLEASDPEHTDFKKVLNIAKAVSNQHHFRYIQFPFNLLEMGALATNPMGESLIGLAREHGIKTLINRPLNAFSNNAIIRLATYEKIHPTISDDQATAIFTMAMDALDKKLKLQGYDEDILSIPIIKQIQEIWKTLPTPDAVEQVFHGHFFPFLAKSWGPPGLSAEESRPFYDLFEAALLLARQSMTEKAQALRLTMEEKGLIPVGPELPFALLCCQQYLDWGVDHVLVGMKDTQYVDQLKELF